MAAIFMHINYCVILQMCTQYIMHVQVHICAWLEIHATFSGTEILQKLASAQTLAQTH